MRAADGAGDREGLLSLGWCDVPELLRHGLPPLRHFQVMLHNHGFRIATL